MIQNCLWQVFFVLNQEPIKFHPLHLVVVFLISCSLISHWGRTYIQVYNLKSVPWWIFTYLCKFCYAYFTTVNMTSSSSPRTGKDMQQLNLPDPLAESANWLNHLGKLLAVFKTLQQILILWTSNSSPQSTLQSCTCHQRPLQECLQQLYSQCSKLEKSQISINNKIDNWIVAYVYTKECYTVTKGKRYCILQ